MRVLISHEQLEKRIQDMAREIEAVYGNERILMLCVLKGSVHFFSDLARELRTDTVLDFIQARSYGHGTTSSGVVQIQKDSDISLEGQNVLIVEDIIDTGATLAHLLELLGTRRPKSLRVASLLDKKEARKVPVLVDFVGFEIPNDFVVGYGLDYAEQFRNLPYIAILQDG